MTNESMIIQINPFLTVKRGEGWDQKTGANISPEFSKNASQPTNNNHNPL